jgi:hypothetical protein
MTNTNGSLRSPFSTGHALIVAGLLIGGSLTLVLLTPDVISRDLARRLLGVMLGAFVVYYANAVPKVLPPLIRGNPRAEQAMRRFTAWCIALGGIGYVAAWIIAPLEYANLIAVSCLGSAVIIVVARAFHARSRGMHA